MDFGDAVGAEGAPVVPVGVVGDQVPAAPGGDEAVRLRQPPGGSGVGGGVGEADVLAGDAGGGEGRQDAGVGGGRVLLGGQGDGGRGEGGDAVPQPGRQDLLELGQDAGARCRRRR
ncbi:hypothetical protein GCM10010182_73350 [Actinomadura cremea]|nr:hypothetical protein GCM10010182_73350 [Actinomadura cremea]